MKLPILTLLLPILAAGTAFAQFEPVRLTTPVNPIAGLPKLLPSPMIGSFAGTGIKLPSLLPTLTPALRLPSAAPVAVYLPSSRLPWRGGRLPAPIVRLGDASVPSKPDAAQPDASKEKLDETFDGTTPSRPIVKLPVRGPVSPARRVGLPEKDLERQLGL